MGWRDDSLVQDAIRELLTEIKEPLGDLLNALGKHNDGTPPFQFLKVSYVKITTQLCWLR